MIHNSLRGNKKWIIISYASIILFIFLFFTSYIYVKNFYLNIFSSTMEEENINECTNCVKRNIDGVLVAPEKNKLVPVALMIDNHSEARPSYGLAKANLVYEAEVEGKITRFLAIFASNENIEKIGPIRSARPYYLDWAHELSALYVHCGGSPEALTKIIKENILSINEFYNSDYFWRDKDINAPHNIFASLDVLRSSANYKIYEEDKYFSWIYKEDNIPINSMNPEITINFKEPYAISWKYDIINNNYLRHMNKTVHKDFDGSEIKAKNIIIQLVRAKVIDEKLRLKIETIGSNKAIICLDGECKEGTWNKKNKTARTRYFINNEEVSFNVGTTWIEIIRDENIINY